MYSMIFVRGISLLILMSAFSMGYSTLTAASDFMEIDGDRFCPSKSRLMSHSFAVSNRNRICNSLKDWAVARLAGDGSFSGPGNNCEIYKIDHRKLGSSLCVPLKDFGNIRGVLLQGPVAATNSETVRGSFVPSLEISARSTSGA